MAQETKTLTDKAAKSRRLALRANAAKRTKRTGKLLGMAEEFDREAAGAQAAEPIDDRPVHPFVGTAPAAGSAASEAPLDGKRKATRKA